MVHGNIRGSVVITLFYELSQGYQTLSIAGITTACRQILDPRETIVSELLQLGQFLTC